VTADALVAHLKCHHMFSDPAEEARFQGYGNAEKGLPEFHDLLHRNPQSGVDEDHSIEEISQ
jgi:hypothetical protein